jgi:hypothetical protein
MKRLLAVLLPLIVCSCGDAPIRKHSRAKDPSPVTAPNSDPSSGAADAEPVVQVNKGPCMLSFALSGLCASYTWATEISSQVEGTLALRFWRANDPTGPYVRPEQEVWLKLWMSSMGHGSSPVTIRELAPGEYEVSRIYFSMPGDWDLRFQLKQGTTVVEQVVVRYDVE